MQAIYYDNTSSLYLEKDDGTVKTWSNITSLVTSSTSINAYSGSFLITTFPYGSTNIYYTGYPASIQTPLTVVPSIPAITSNAQSGIYYTFTVAGGFTALDLSGSYFLLSQTTPPTSSIVTAKAVTRNGSTTVSSNNTYNVIVNKVSGSIPYTASLWIQDNYFPDDDPSYYVFTGSNYNGSISASFVAQVAHSYTIYTSIYNTAVPISYWFNVTSSYTPGMAASSSFYVSQPTPTLTVTGSLSGPQSGTTTVAVGTMAYIGTTSNVSFFYTGSLTVYNTRTSTYLYSSSVQVGSEGYNYGWIPQPGDSYIVSASMGTTGSA